MSSSLVRSLGLVAVVATGIALAGCAPAVEDEPSASPGVTSTATGEPTATGSPAPTETPGTTAPTTDPTTKPTTNPNAGEPVGLACDQLITLQQMYDFNSNVSLLGPFTPKASALSAKVAAFKGLTCRSQQNSSGNALDFSVAKLDKATLEQLANQAVTNSKSVPTYGVEGYFNRANGIGTAQAFSGSYWIVAESADFIEPGDVAPLMEAMIGNLS
ncbi:hypothetical protein SAMN04489806_2454 [Paramicrobacterium humi]|uniref:Uncharacterized protein n=1 Tax=Paramicrobacterium humi TaxID=640635 RepID=A0A1H4PBF4_9MICO|nr:iron ABC transporter ATP-binding protein [Microbacterium humi]SEC04578.1 hypothetical protein SAMN04489806_2454 [Microbacterium humi]